MTGSGKLRKFGLNKILAAVIAFSLLCVPFSVLADVSPVTSPLTEPVPSFTSDTLEYYIIYYHASEPHYRVNHITITFSDSTQTFWDAEGTFLFSSGAFDSLQNIYDVETGNLITSISGAASYNSYHDRYQKSMQSCDGNVSGLYFIAPSELTITYTSKVVEPFVTWAVDVPEQTQYKSVLSEPVADIHNRYIVVNDTLYWISFYVNSVWAQAATFQNNVSSETGVASGSESGTYLDEQNSEYFYYQSTESITYNDIEYFPLSLTSSSVAFEQMIYPCLISGSPYRLSFNTDTISEIYGSSDDYLLDYQLYCSSFNLEDGSYIESFYSANTVVSTADISINVELPEEVESVRCYGVVFVNNANLPVNLASVLWSYDYVFETWRADMYVKLAGIYNLLAQSETPSTTTPVDYAGLLEDPSALSGYNAEDAGQLLSEVAVNAEDQIGDGMEWGSTQIQSIFSIAPELFLVVVIALAFGLAVLILGKKKSDN